MLTHGVRPGRRRSSPGRSDARTVREVRGRPATNRAVPCDGGAADPARRPPSKTLLPRHITMWQYNRMSAYAALAEPHRRQILDLLRDGPRPAGDLVERLDLSQPGVSKHLRVLREAGLVDVRTDGRRRLYSLRAEPLLEIDQWIAPYRAYWSNRLDALERHLETNP